MATRTISRADLAAGKLPAGTYYSLLVRPDGSITLSDTAPASQGAAVTDLGTLTVTGEDAAAVAASATTQVNAVGTKLNALLASLRTAGVIAT